jgi:hypothetical protein
VLHQSPRCGGRPSSLDLSLRRATSEFGDINAKTPVDLHRTAIGSLGSGSARRSE